jgi:hypothetical protein
MIENIEKVLDRGEKLDLLVDKTEHLQGEAFAFRREARRARRVLWWKVSRGGSGCSAVKGKVPRSTITYRYAEAGD